MPSIVIPNTFLPSTTISSTAMNANFSDVADAIENSLARDGTDAMLSALQLVNGAAGSPALTFATDLDTGIYRKAADSLGFATAGSERGYFDSAGKLFLLAAADITGAVAIAGTLSPTTLAVTVNGTVGGTLGVTGVLSALSTLELGHASDTTLSRAAAGVLAVEGLPIYAGIPQNSQSAAYTTVLADAQKHILHPSSDNNARTFTIAANASVAYPIGTAITFVNQINTVTIAINSDTLVMASSGATGSRTLAANGIATALKIDSTTWIISGTALS
jgi:hypothetical protein